MRSPHEVGRAFGESVAARGPRTVGAMMISLGLVCLVGNAALLYGLDRYMPTLLALAFPLLSTGLYILVTGRAEQTPDNPTWWKVGYGAGAVMGLLAGVYVAFWLLG